MLVYVKGSNISKNPQKLNISLYDLYGKRVWSEDFAQNGTGFNHAINLDKNLSSGIYFVQTEVDGKRVVKKLIIQ